MFTTVEARSLRELSEKLNELEGDGEDVTVLHVHYANAILGVSLPIALVWVKD